MLYRLANNNAAMAGKAAAYHAHTHKKRIFSLPRVASSADLMMFGTSSPVSSKKKKSCSAAIFNFLHLLPVSRRTAPKVDKKQVKQETPPVY